MRTVRKSELKKKQRYFVELELKYKNHNRIIIIKNYSVPVVDLFGFSSPQSSSSHPLTFLGLGSVLGDGLLDGGVDEADLFSIMEKKKE